VSATAADGARRQGAVSTVQAVLDELLARTGASRVTLRRDLPGERVFPVTDEALAPDVASLRSERTVDLRTQPVALEVLEIAAASAAALRLADVLERS
jgi:tRNA threonylcarbamoyladenosine modification (KEOPS) complex  Pcc1 subunit